MIVPLLAGAAKTMLEFKNQKRVSSKMKHTHTTHKQKTFIQEYVSTGDGVKSALRAGYSNRSLPSLRAEASRLKRRLSSQIAEELRINILNSVPKALGILQNLAVNAESEAVQLKASIHILNMGGYKPVTRQERHHVNRTVEEVEAELMGLVGPDLGELLLGKKNKAVVN